MTITAGGRQILIQGLTMILAGLFWGFAPGATPFPRLAVGAHVQFETNGALFVVLGILLLAVPHSAGEKTVRVIAVSAWLTWLMALSEVANSWWGANQMLPVAAGQAGAKGAEAWQELVVKLCHIPAALGLILSIALLIRSLVGQREIAA
jgi:hydroxylaminobenzene mutase